MQKIGRELLKFVSDDVRTLGKERFFLKNYDQTLAPVCGSAAKPEGIVVEGGR